MKEAKPVKFNLHQHQDHQNGHLAPFKLAKLIDPEASWDKDQLGDVLHWIRQAVAVVLGLLWGSIPLVGGIWFLIFLAISTSVVYGYYAMILKVDEEEFGGHGALLQEGLFASITLFLGGTEGEASFSLPYSLSVAFLYFLGRGGKERLLTARTQHCDYLIETKELEGSNH
ncbi:Rab5-interacting [Cucumis melo var. makuwa]|uniref:Rab5-interacting n=1 Tax=Cucumis melo var. makuwa TaxID=1194695 RepID=A0A5A7V3N1_CUCMM|nr:Rab5-interacting [Cucumis melo var. makuwa]